MTHQSVNQSSEPMHNAKKGVGQQKNRRSSRKDEIPRREKDLSTQEGELAKEERQMYNIASSQTVKAKGKCISRKEKQKVDKKECEELRVSATQGL